MSNEQTKRLHTTYTSKAYTKENRDPRVTAMLEQPHLAVFINGEWLPLLPGMIIGLMRNIQHVDGIAPYKIKKVGLSAGKEFIDLEAYSSDSKSTRKLQFLANYSGVYRTETANADAAIASTLDKKNGQRGN